MTQEEVIGRVVEVLMQLGVPYMVAGSFASNLHGVPRMTQDADLVIDADESLVVRLAKALEGEFYVSEDAAREAVRLRRMFNVIHLDTGFKIDLVIKKRRAFSDEELRRRERGPLAGLQVDFATAEDTILTKLEWAKLGDSERQYADAVGIMQVQGRRIDWTYLERWATALGLTDLLARARRGERYRD
ncbi:MAG: hypothetical protein HY698_04195 [Deltaproteobacteria bacterium]|nr:hypothetical protein [Deltaproteobacteria bacterium]